MSGQLCVFLENKNKGRFIGFALRPYSKNPSYKNQQQAVLIFDQILSTFRFLDGDVEDEMSEWKTYRNEEWGFEFKYPSYWETPRFKNNNVYISAGEFYGGERETSSLTPNTMLTISILGSLSGNQSLENWFLDKDECIKGYLKNKEEEMDTYYWEGFITSPTCTEGGGNVTVIFVANNEIYKFNFGTFKPGSEEKAKELVKKIVYSVSFE